MGRPWPAAWWLALSAFACFSIATDVQAAKRFDDVRDYIRKSMAAQAVPSLSVAVAMEGELLWMESFGWADRERRLAAGADTMYALASVTKPITATALMMLVESGKIDLDRPVNDYLGNAKLRSRVGNESAATVRRVASHTSGLAAHANFVYAPSLPLSVDETIVRYGDIVTAPGERYEYSNLGYAVLGLLVERASGMSLARYLRTNLFLPLDLQRSSLELDPALQPYVAVSYGEDGRPLPAYRVDTPGASSGYASVRDLVRFGMFHIRGGVREAHDGLLSDAGVHAMQQRATPRDGEGYGIGFRVADIAGRRVVEHGGWMPGAATMLRLIPQEGLVIAVLSNSADGLPFEVSDLITSRFIAEWPKTGVGPTPVNERFVTPSELLGAWRGTIATYAGDLPIQLTFLPGAHVHARIGEQLTNLVNRARFDGARFSGVVNGRIGTPDTERQRYNLLLSLQLRGQVLNGVVTTSDQEGEGNGNWLSHWVELRQEVAP